MVALNSLRSQRSRVLPDILLAAGIEDEDILQAFGKVPRAEFLGAGLHHRAIDNDALPIGLGQTTSQPWVIARMLELALVCDRPARPVRVLEVGAGCGYATALLSLLSDEVYAIERIRALARSTRTRLRRLGYHNVTIVHGDGKVGMAAYAPFGAVIVCAATSGLPPALVEQLEVGGRVVLPEKQRGRELLTVYRKEGDGTMLRTEHDEVIFVPLLGGVE